MITVRKDQYVTVMSKNNPPAARVQCGEPVLFEVEITLRELVDTGKLPDPIDFNTIVHAAGPVYVEGAEPGDILITEFKNFVPYHAGWSAALSNFGMLQDETATDYAKVVPIRDGKIIWSDKLQVPAKIFPGTVGVAPAGEGITCLLPGPHGGNLDNSDLTTGSRLFLPVLVPGALFQIADIHAAMGDGEIGGTAVETGADVTIVFDLVKGVHIEGPMTEHPDWIALVVSHEDLSIAVREASRRMRKLVSEV
ncbi:MAG: acetamidase/formamidase family protein, partial [Chloroflexi bacterium]|nr:acetamidase/formamidase family protein [Chloroflexota bacterium]